MMARDPYEGRKVFLDVGNGTKNPRVRIKQCPHCERSYTIPVEEFCPGCGYDAGTAYRAGKLNVPGASIRITKGSAPEGC